MQTQGIKDVWKAIRDGSLSAVADLLSALKARNLDGIQDALRKLLAALGFQAEAKELNDFIDEIQDRDFGGSLSEAADVLKLIGERFRKSALPTPTISVRAVYDAGTEEVPLSLVTQAAETEVLLSRVAIAEDAQPEWILETIAVVGLIINVIRFVRERRKEKQKQ